MWPLLLLFEYSYFGQQEFLFYFLNWYLKYWHLCKMGYIEGSFVIQSWRKQSLQKIIAWLVWNTNIWNPWSTFERGDKAIGKMSAKMTKTLSIMVFPNYQDESSVVRSWERERERCTGETSRYRRCLDECFIWRELLVLSFTLFSPLWLLQLV